MKASKICNDQTRLNTKHQYASTRILGTHICTYLIWINLIGITKLNDTTNDLQQYSFEFQHQTSWYCGEYRHQKM